MRESNFAFPAQNKACVCITSQLYDRRALDTTAPLPLFNSLTHLTYLTSTSPRIREIMTMDGGLERLVRILHDFCLCPPPPENPALLYGLTPPAAKAPRPAPALNPPAFDKHAAYRFSLAFQCIVNIGVRGSEPIRSRVVQAGTLEVVGCILEAWLANKGFAVGPSATATGIPRETREQRQQRRLAQIEQRQREEAQHLQRALQRQLQMEQQQVQRGAVTRRRNQDQDQSTEFSPRRRNQDQDQSMEFSPQSNVQGILLLSESVTTSNNNSDTDASADASIAVTPQGTGTPTGTVVVPARDRSGTVIGRPVWDQPMPNNTLTPTATTIANTSAARGRRTRHRELPPESPSPSPSTDVSRAETETEDDIDAADTGNNTDGERATSTDGDVDMDGTHSGRTSHAPSASPSPARRPPAVVRHAQMGRRAVGIVSDEPGDAQGQTLQLAGRGVGVALGLPGLGDDAHIVLDGDAEGGMGLGMGLGMGGGLGITGMGAEGMVGVEAGIVSLEANDDFAMGAPPGAPGALGGGPDGTPTRTAGGEARRRGTVEAANGAPDVTPRAALVGLPPSGGASGAGHAYAQASVAAASGRQAAAGPSRAATLRGRPEGLNLGSGSGAAAAEGAHAASATARPASTATMPTTATPPATTAPAAPALPGASARAASPPHSSRDAESGPYRDEDVLLSLQLLAYLSKYPHVRQAFYTPRVTFHPASVGVGGARFGGAGGGAPSLPGRGKEKEREKKEAGAAAAPREGFFKAFTASRAAKASAAAASTSTAAPASTSASGGAPSSARQTNVFSLVERFTFKPSSSEGGGEAVGPPRLPPEIQYWAGVIMRNACRKDDSRGGIRQCANMMCGKWETYPREFAKCRRCRKAKYCGKECQSTAWSEGHRFWCSAKDVDDDGATATNAPSSATAAAALADTSIASNATDVSQSEGTAAGPTHRAAQRAERQRMRHGATHGPEGDLHPFNVPADNSSTMGPHGTVRGPPSAGASYVSPTTAAAAMTSAATVRAEASNMARERTVVAHGHTHGHTHRTRMRLAGGASPVAPTQATAALAAATQLQQQQRQQQDPTDGHYLTFHIQGQEAAGTSGSRRRAETVAGIVNAAAGARERSAGAVPPHVVVPTAQRPVVLPHHAVSPLADWPMGGAADAARAVLGRRHAQARMLDLSVRRSPPPQDEQDDMVLGEGC
ncbi:hypothetical protein BJ912DRAFT_1041109 [Pholiota molesta]|nr:hypothetical protein BJ912DRAFT_1041109 [Pholiota molesta]